jgi:ABC-type Fe3+ transport system substrate-binding protein
MESDLGMVRRLIFLAVFFMWAAPVHAQDKLVLVSPHSDEIQNEFSDGFEVHYQTTTGRTVSLEWLDVGGGTSSILRYIKSEFNRQPDGIQIDLFFGGGLDPYTELADAGILQPYRLPDKVLSGIATTIGGIPVYDPEFRWFGATLAGFGIVYNKRVLEILNFAVPKTWEALGDPRYSTWVGSGDPRFSGSVHMAYELILQAYGWDRGWEVITTMGANVRNFTGSGGQAPKDVAVGEVAFGLSIDFYAWAQVAEVGDAFIGFTMPDNMTIVNPDGLGILKGAENLDVARAFVSFVMSEPGQKLWFLKQGAKGGPIHRQLNRFTVMPELYGKYRQEAAVTLNPFEWRSDLIYDSVKASARWSILNDLIGVFVIDSHDRLRWAWGQAQKDGLAPEEVRRLSAMPLSERAAHELGSVWRQDQELRVQKLSEWSTFARDKYGEPDNTTETIINWLTFAFPIGITLGTVWMMQRTRGV